MINENTLSAIKATLAIIERIPEHTLRNNKDLARASALMGAIDWLTTTGKFDDGKANRWLGYAHAVLIQYQYATVDQLRDITRPLFNPDGTGVSFDCNVIYIENINNGTVDTTSDLLDYFIKLDIDRIRVIHSTHYEHTVLSTDNRSFIIHAHKYIVDDTISSLVYGYYLRHPIKNTKTQ